MSDTALRWAIVVFAAVTALVHLMLGVSSLSSGDMMFGPLFLLNGLGYLGLLGALLLNIRFLASLRSLVLYVFVFYTALTFVLYFVFNGFTFGGAAIVAKLAELLLIIALLLYRPHIRRAA